MQSIPFQLERLCTGHLWTTPLCALQVWKLSDLQTIPEAVEAFSNISAVPLDLCRWHGSKKEARASSMAFSRFKNGLLLRQEPNGCLRKHHGSCGQGVMDGTQAHPCHWDNKLIAAGMQQSQQ